jgi:hypothetical protein
MQQIATAIDNIFIKVSKFENCITSPLIIGLADHDAQLITINYIDLKIQNSKSRFIRNIDKYAISDFKIKLSYETWDNVFDNKDANFIYNSFLLTYLRVFYSSFPLRKLNTKCKSNAWITTGRTSCKLKRELYLVCKNSNDPLLKNHYKLYCKTLSNVIKEAKKCYYNKLIENSKNKIKTVWDITKSLTGVKANNEDVHQLNINGNIYNNSQTISDFFNNYFLFVIGKGHKAINQNNNNSADYLYQAFNKPFSNIRYQYSSPLCHICNKILSSGIFPTRLKYAVIKPIFKKGDKNDMSNYRPISHLPSFSKVFKKVFYARMYQHLINNNILVNEQFGFRTNYLQLLQPPLV